LGGFLTEGGELGLETVVGLAPAEIVRGGGGGAGGGGVLVFENLLAKGVYGFLVERIWVTEHGGSVFGGNGFVRVHVVLSERRFGSAHL
jgi:hypothetical protein